MSANRIVKRRAFKASRTTEFTHWAAVRRGGVVESLRQIVMGPVAAAGGVV